MPERTTHDLDDEGVVILRYLQRKLYTRDGAKALPPRPLLNFVASAPRDRDASSEPQMMKKRQRRLGGVENIVISLSAKGLTPGEISAHLREVYGAEVSKQANSAITDRVMDAMADWQNRPLDSVYPVLFPDCVNVKIRDANVANRPIFVAMGVTVDGSHAPRATGFRWYIEYDAPFLVRLDLRFDFFEFVPQREDHGAP